MTDQTVLNLFSYNNVLCLDLPGNAVYMLLLLRKEKYYCWRTRTIRKSASRVGSYLIVYIIHHSPQCLVYRGIPTSMS